MNDIDLSVNLVNAAQARLRARRAAAERAKAQRRKNIFDKIKLLIWHTGAVIIAGMFWLLLLGSLAALYLIIWG